MLLVDLTEKDYEKYRTLQINDERQKTLKLKKDNQGRLFNTYFVYYFF
jgi:hypothetical protein